MSVQPLPADFGVLATKGPLLDRAAARIIRWDTAAEDRGHLCDSPVNHAILAAGSPNGGTQIFEAVSRVRLDWAGAYDGDPITWSTGRLPAELTPSPAQRVEIVRAAQKMIGLRYNVLDLLAIGLAQKRTGGLVSSKTWWARRANDENKVICSELVVRAYRAAGIDLAPGRLAALVSPQDLYALLLPEAAA
jgi:hypothetical protein